MPILSDYNQLVISCVFEAKEDMLKGKDVTKMHHIIRHMTLNVIASYVTKYTNTYGELILCCDSKPTWRSKEFPFYKKHRSKDREESPIDWDSVFVIMDELRNELETIFPYAVIKADEAEGDDCIAVITKYINENGTVDNNKNPLEMLMDDVNSEKILILSSDYDFKQLHKYKNVDQWAILQKKWIKVTDKDFLVEKIITGDIGDGVPSVLMEDDFLINGEGRAKSVTAKVKEKFKNYDGLTEDEKKRFDRNRALIDFSYIPERVEKRIVEQYLKPRNKLNRQNILNYLIKKKCSELINRIGDF